MLQVPLWTVEDVSGWVARAGFTEFSEAFAELRVDGDMLLQLTETEIRDDIGLVNGILRKRFLRELRELKKSADYTSCDGGLMANFLHKISPEYKIYTYNLILKEVSLDFMQRLSAVDLDDMLKDCGVESSIHRHRVIETVLSLDSEDAGSCSLSESGFSEPGTDVYISYSQAGGAELASLIKIQLEQRDREMSILAECHDSGLQDRALARLRDCRHYVLILGPGGLDQCLQGEQRRLHMELVTALKSGVKIIPVTVEFSWPEPELFPEDIRALTSFNGVRWIHDYQDACLDKLERFIRGEVSRVSSPFTTRRDSGRSTPLSSPMIYHKVLKNRAISFENVNSSQST